MPTATKERRPSDHSTPRLSEVARHLVIPDGIVSSVWPRVERRLASVGVQFDLWQQGFSSAALGCREDGKYAATVGGVVESIPRQVGKTYKDGNIAIGLAAEFPGLRVAWTSHHLRTTTNTFRKMQGLVTRPKMKSLLAPNGIRLANGEQEIRFANDSIIMFGARSEGFGRGIDELDILFFDEAQILGLKALEDMVPATNQAKHPHGGLVFLLGTPPRPTDDGEAFTAMRRAALDGSSNGRMYVELSADPDAAWDDRAQWRKMNPSYPHRTPEEAMLRMRELIPGEDAWRREAMGIWDEEDYGPQWKVIPRKDWDDKADSEGSDEGWLTGPASLGIEKPFEGGLVSIGAAGACRSGGVGMQLVAQVPPEQVAGLIVTLTSDPDHPVSHVAIDSKGPAAGLVPGLVAAGVVLLEPKYDDLRQCTGDLFDDLTGPRGAVWHRNQPVVNASVGHLTTRARGDAQLIERKGEADSAPFGCLNLARWAHLQPVATSVYESRGLVQM